MSKNDKMSKNEGSNVNEKQDQDTKSNPQTKEKKKELQTKTDKIAQEKNATEEIKKLITEIETLSKLDGEKYRKATEEIKKLIAEIETLSKNNQIEITILKSEYRRIETLLTEHTKEAANLSQEIKKLQRKFQIVATVVGLSIVIGMIMALCFYLPNHSGTAGNEVVYAFLDKNKIKANDARKVFQQVKDKFAPIGIHVTECVGNTILDCPYSDVTLLISRYTTGRDDYPVEVQAFLEQQRNFVLVALKEGGPPLNDPRIIQFSGFRTKDYENNIRTILTVDRHDNIQDDHHNNEQMLKFQQSYKDFQSKQKTLL